MPPRPAPEPPGRLETMRLASIVAIDVAGYSELAERDQKAAADIIMGIREAAEAIVARHQGRVFNTAGDGLMLEFPAAERALSAIVDFIDNPVHDVSLIRIGAHLGDVYVAENGDLLGHGVNVSARLQALATPGTALVSADLCSAIQGDRRQRLRSKGRVTLPKIKQRLDVFEIAPNWRSKTPRPPSAASAPRKRRVPFWAVAALIIAVAIATSSSKHKSGSSDSKQEQAAKIPLVAVLPFDNLSDAPNSQYLADGISEEILDALTRAGAVKVAARTSSFAFRGAKKAEAGEELDADYVLDGSIRRGDGNHLRITVYLNDVHHGGTVWSQSYDRSISMTLALEDEIAGEVAHALSIVLVSGKTPKQMAATGADSDSDDTGDDQAASSAPAPLKPPNPPAPPSFDGKVPGDRKVPGSPGVPSQPNPPADGGKIDPHAYELYLRGVQAGQERSAASTLQAVEDLKQALEKEPNFSRAWSALAHIQAKGAASSGQSDEGQDNLEEAKHAALRALALDPKSADAFMALADLDEDWYQKAKYLQKGLAVAPNDSVVVAAWGKFLASAGYEGDAVPVLRRAVELDPLNPIPIVSVADALVAAGDADGAKQILADGLKRLPMSLALWRQKFRLSLLARDYGDADRILASETKRPEGYSGRLLENDRLLYRAYRSHSDADIKASLAAEEAAVTGGDASGLVWSLAVLGQNDEAFAMADKYQPAGAVLRIGKDAAEADPDHSLAEYLNPALASFRRDPRFMRLWDKDRLTDYWLRKNQWPDFCADPNLGYDCKADAKKLLAARPENTGHADP